MKKIIYGILVCMIIVGTIITFTIGLNVDMVYRKNIEIDIYIGKEVQLEEIKQIAKEVFQNEKIIVQKIELFDDMVSITLKDRNEDEIKEQLELLNTKINEKYEIDNKVDEDITIVHNPKVKLSNILKPYILPVAVSMIIILTYVAIRYRKIGIIKTLLDYVGNIVLIEGAYYGLLAITRFPINRLVIPIGMVIYIITVTILSLKNEIKLENIIQTEKNKNK